MAFLRNCSPENISHRNCFVFWLVATLIFLIYSNTLNDVFHLDDSHNIVNLENIHMEHLTINELKQSTLNKENNLNRPVARISFALNWYFGKSDVKGYHVVNIIIHILTCFFLYLSILLLLESPFLPLFYSSHKQFIALLAAVLWAANPIQTQAVTYIVQRMASMAALFYIAGIFLYLKAKFSKNKKHRYIYYLSTAFVFLLAIGCKENAIMFPVSILLIEICFFYNFESKNSKRLIIISGLSFLGVMAIGVIAFWMFRHNPVDYFINFADQYKDRPFTLQERILTQPRIIIFHLTQIFYPIADRLSISHDIALSKSLFHPITTLVSILIIFALIIFSVKYLRKYRILSFSILFFLINHLIESSIFPLELIFEHRNYLPSLFLFFPLSILMAYGIDFYKNQDNNFFSNILIIFSLLLLILLGTGTYLRNITWDTEKTLWQDAVKKAPGQARPYNNLGIAISNNDIEKNERLQFSALTKIPKRLNKGKIVSYANLSLIYSKNGELKLAEEYAKKVLESIPDMIKVRKRLIFVYLKMGKYGKALDHADLILKNKPELKVIMAWKGFILLKKHKPKSAYPVIKESYLDNLDSKRTLLNMGCVLMMLDEYKKSLKYLTRAKELFKESLTPYMLIVQNHLQTKNHEKAKQLADEIFNRFPLERIDEYVNLVNENGNMLWPTNTDIVGPFLNKMLNEKEILY